MTVIDTDDLVEELEHEIITIDGITMLIPTLLASDIAHDLLIDFGTDTKILMDDIKYDCAKKLDTIFTFMVNETKRKLEENEAIVENYDDLIKL